MRFFPYVKHPLSLSKPRLYRHIGIYDGCDSFLQATRMVLSGASRAKSGNQGMMCWVKIPRRWILSFAAAYAANLQCGCAAKLTTKTTERTDQMKELNLQVERLEQRIAPGLLDCVTVPCVTAPSTDCTSSTDTSSSDSCPPPSDTSGGNNGYGNGGYDGVPGSSADNGSPNADEKAADQVR